MKRRMLTMALAVLLAAGGTAGILIYVHQANARAINGLKAVTVLVAGSRIPSGTSADAALHEGLLVRDRLPASSVPANAVGSITADLGPLVMSAPVESGQLLLRQMLVPAAQATGGVAIPTGMVAVTLQLCLPAAVAGNVHAGSQVAIFDTYGDRSLNVQETCGQSHQSQATGAVHTRIVLRKVEVVSVGSAPSSGQGGSSGSPALANDPATASGQQGLVLVTLAVSQADAERVITLSQAGLPYLALLTPASHTAFDSTPVPLFQP